MRLSLTRRVGIAAGVCVLAGAGGAYAVTQGSSGSRDDRRQAFLNDAAKRLNVSPEELRSALQGAFFDQLDKAVADGKLSKEEADAIKERVKKGGLPFLGGPGPGPGPGPGFRHGPGFPPPPGFGRGPLHGPIAAAAKFLDLDPAKLHEQLESGKSLAQIARDRGKSVDDLKQAIVGAVTKDLDQAVKDKRLTDAQRDRMLKDLSGHIDDIVNRKGREHGGFRHFRRGRGGPPGPGFGPPPPGFPGPPGGP
jgi:hypothetical protein